METDPNLPQLMASFKQHCLQEEVVDEQSIQMDEDDELEDEEFLEDGVGDDDVSSIAVPCMSSGHMQLFKTN